MSKKESKHIEQGAKVVMNGGVIAYPTEGVFGLGCLPDNYEAVNRILNIKKRDIKNGLIVIASSLDQLKDWVNRTQNLICKYYVDKILVHGDPEILPLYSDRTVAGSSAQLIDDLKDQIVYTGYVCDDSLPKHKNENNISLTRNGKIFAMFMKSRIWRFYLRMLMWLSEKMTPSW